MLSILNYKVAVNSISNSFCIFWWPYFRATNWIKYYRTGKTSAFVRWCECFICMATRGNLFIYWYILQGNVFLDWVWKIFWVYLGLIKSKFCVFSGTKNQTGRIIFPESEHKFSKKFLSIVKRGKIELLFLIKRGHSSIT